MLWSCVVRRVLQANGECVQGSVNARKQALQFILAHSKTRKMDDDGLEQDPDLLPRDKLLTVLADVIASSSDLRTVGQLRVCISVVYLLFTAAFAYCVQNVAMSAFSELCEGASGKDDCGRGTAADIRVLLDCLLSPLQELRHIAVKGLQSMIEVLPSAGNGDESDTLVKLLTRRVFVAQFDLEESVNACAKQYVNISLYTCRFLASYPSLLMLYVFSRML